MVYEELLVFVPRRNLHLAVWIGTARHGPAIGKVCGIHLSNPINGDLGAIRECFPLTSAFAGDANPHTMNCGRLTRGRGMEVGIGLDEDLATILVHEATSEEIRSGSAGNQVEDETGMVENGKKKHGRKTSTARKMRRSGTSVSRGGFRWWEP